MATSNLARAATLAPLPRPRPADPALARARKVARAILAEVMAHRRLAGPASACAGADCPACLAPHLAKVTEAVLAGRPVTFVLPAFPGKSPNPAKVLGPLPDLGEQLALAGLDDLAARVRRHHAPGARILLGSDGRVFSDVVGLDEADVTAYHAALAAMIAEAGHAALALFSLDDVAPQAAFAEAREALLAEHGCSLEDLRARVRRGGAGSDDMADREAHRLFCGITRFLLEDASHPGQTASRNALQQACRARAYEVIRRSHAWGELLAARFPEAVRLSIHPQTCGAAKLGLAMLQGDPWMTPWHGVAVETPAGVVLMKRAEAERLGAELVADAQGRPSHFRLAASQVSGGMR